MIISYDRKKPDIHPTCFQTPDSVIIGDVVIGEESSVWFGAVIRGDINYIRIGSWTNIQDGSVIHVTGGTSPTEVGDFVTVGHRAILHGCKVGNGCLIGMGAIILDDAIIGDGALVAAGAVVTPGTKVPARTLYAGNPAVSKREVSEEESAGFITWARQYNDYAKRYSL